MDKIINITIKDKIATAPDDALYICGNSDFTVNFDFDSEWDAYETKTARFIHDGTYTDVVFRGNQCAMPIISNTYNIKVGVFAGNLHTTTPAFISAKKSILCEGGSPEAPSDDVYNQIMELLKDIGDPDPETIAAAVAEYISKNPIEEKDPSVPEWAKTEKKPTYTADEVGALPKDTKIPSKTSDLTNDSGFITGFTETDPTVASWAKQPTKPSYTASEVGALPIDTVIPTVPDKLPNPYALTFTGAVEGSYDGSAPLTVEVPSGGGGEEREWVELGDIDCSVISGEIKFEGLDNFTEFLILWDGVKNSSTVASGYTAIINGKSITSFDAIPSGKEGSTDVHGYTYLRFNGLFWEIRRSGGAILSSNFQMASNNALYPHNIVLDVGKAMTIEFGYSTAAYAATSGVITVWGR